MDPLTHTLFGATLAKSGLERRSALAFPTLLIGANLPDIDAVATFAGDDYSLAVRRGLTHGLPALLILPLLLVGAMVLYGRYFRKKDAPPIVVKQLLFLSYLSVWSHPALDWLNTYGIRLLMPFDGTWFYGDSLFIVDPWIWLLLGGTMFLIASQTRKRQASWGVLALLTSLFVVGGSQFLLGHKGSSLIPLLWFGAIVLLIFLRRSHLPTEPKSGKVIMVLGIVGLYIGLMIATTLIAEHQVKAALQEQGLTVQEVMVGPVPFNPLRGEVVVEMRDAYRVGSFDWLDEPGWRLEEKTWPKPATTPVIEAAMAAPSARGFVNWARFPIAEVIESPSGYQVYLRDLRYTRDREQGFGVRRVELDRDLNPIP